MLDLAAVPVLETARLRLRLARESDFPAYAEMQRDPEVMRFLNAGIGMTERGAWHSFAVMVGQWALRGYGMLVVEPRVGEGFIGRVGIYHPESWPGPELAWTLARAHWNKGYATEAATAVRDWVFGTLKMPRLISVIDPANSASIRVAEKIGETLDRETEIEGKAVRVYAIENPARA
ncbi:MAG TPA: GNAT family N-acetyltransferase [Stellaceae bacterium]|nr:GNAT family N-acetyltransferase [Stellaceae bacterium]